MDTADKLHTCAGALALADLYAPADVWCAGCGRPGGGAGRGQHDRVGNSLTLLAGALATAESSIPPGALVALYVLPAVPAAISRGAPSQFWQPC